MKSISRQADTPRSRERGVALPVALFALLVVDALVFGSFAAAWLEQQAGDNRVFAAQALEAAEAGLTDAVSGVDPLALAALLPGGPPLSLGSSASGAGVTVDRDITRLTGTLFMVRSAGIRSNADGRPLAQRRLGLLLRLAPPAAGGTGGGVPALIPLAERAWISLS